MSLESSQPLNQADLTRLDHFLRSHSCGQEAMGLSYAHGFLTAIASGPERLESEEWLRLVFDEPVFHSGHQAQEMLGLALRLFGDIDHRLKTNVGFLPMFDIVRTANNQKYDDAQPWCLGFTDGLKLFSECWTADANTSLRGPLSIIFSLADIQGQPNPGYAKLCQTVPDAAEYIYCYWQRAASP
jgi:uncharacterized protein